jgi:hypothetical protein
MVEHGISVVYSLEGSEAKFDLASAALDGVSDNSCLAAELGRQLSLIHVETPKRGRIHICSANQETNKPTITRTSIFEDPSELVITISLTPQPAASNSMGN